MASRETEWKLKQLTLKSRESMLHERLQQDRAREHKAQLIEHHDEAYILDHFIKGSSNQKLRHLPASGLRRKQTRNIFIVIADNVFFVARAAFDFCVSCIERFLELMIPANQARGLGIMVTIMTFALLSVAAVSKASSIYSAVSHSINSRTVLKELRALL